MAAPASGEGVQIVIPPFDVPPGTEVQDDYYRKLPSDSTFDVVRLQVATNPGTHHMNIFNSDSAEPDHEVDSTFNNSSIFQEADLMLEAQDHYLDWTLPPGIGIRLDANQQMIVQSHYVNGTTSQTTPNNKGKVIINLYRAQTPITQLGSMLFAQNRAVYLPPHSDTSYTKLCLFQGVQRPIRILAMTGHFHDRGKQFTVERFDLRTMKPIDTIYQSANWAEPNFESYTTQNLVLTDDSICICYVCHYVNNSDIAIPFGPRTDINEHANLFLWWISPSSDGNTLYDFTK